jgi:hypothetical protein
MNAQESVHLSRRVVSRAAAGRKPGGRVSHHGRPSISRPAPILATWRVKDDRRLRGKKLLRQLQQALRKCHRKEGFRVTHFAVRGAEVQMIVEADDASRLSRGMQGLGVSMARRLNRSARRRGAAFADRFCAQALRTPTEVARVLEQLHAGPRRFRSEAQPRQAGLALVARPRTWLMRIGRMRAALHFNGGPRTRLRWWWPPETSSWLRQRLRS